MVDPDSLACRGLQSGLSRLASESDEVRLESSRVGVAFWIELQCLRPPLYGPSNVSATTPCVATTHLTCNLTTLHCLPPQTFRLLDRTACHLSSGLLPYLPPSHLPFDPDHYLDTTTKLRTQQPPFQERPVRSLEDAGPSPYTSSTGRWSRLHTACGRDKEVATTPLATVEMGTTHTTLAMITTEVAGGGRRCA